MEGKIFGIPLVLILLVLAIVVSILVPMTLYQKVILESVSEVKQVQIDQMVQTSRVEKLLIPTPTATPSATPVPTTVRRVTTPTPTEAKE